jgi:hypothetical protein
MSELGCGIFLESEIIFPHISLNIHHNIKVLKSRGTNVILIRI